jgi:hypothetical protein
MNQHATIEVLLEMVFSVVMCAEELQAGWSEDNSVVEVQDMSQMVRTYADSVKTHYQ